MRVRACLCRWVHIGWVFIGGEQLRERFVGVRVGCVRVGGVGKRIVCGNVVEHCIVGSIVGRQPIQRGCR